MLTLVRKNLHSNFILYTIFRLTYLNFSCSLGIIPHRHPITVVTGAPLKVDKVENPTREQIGELHDRYVEGVKRLYEEYNPIYGDKNIPLVIT